MEEHDAQFGLFLSELARTLRGTIYLLRNPQLAPAASTTSQV